MATPRLRAEAAAAGNYPANRFNQRERKILKSAADYAQAGKKTTVGGSATQTITVAGAVAADIAHVTIQTVGAVPRTVTSAIAGAGIITVVMSGDPSTDHILCWSLIQG